MAASKALLDALGFKSNAALFNQEGRFRKFRKLGNPEFVVESRTCCGLRELTGIGGVSRVAIRRNVVAGVACFLLGYWSDSDDGYWSSYEDEDDDMDEPGELILRSLLYFGTKQAIRDILLEFGFEEFTKFYNPNTGSWVYGMCLTFKNKDDPSEHFDGKAGGDHRDHVYGNATLD